MKKAVSLKSAQVNEEQEEQLVANAIINIISPMVTESHGTIFSDIMRDVFSGPVIEMQQSDEIRTAILKVIVLGDTKQQ